MLNRLVVDIFLCVSDRLVYELLHQLLIVGDRDSGQTHISSQYCVPKGLVVNLHFKDSSAPMMVI